MNCVHGLLTCRSEQLATYSAHTSLSHKWKCWHMV